MTKFSGREAFATKFLERGEVKIELGPGEGLQREIIEV